MADDTSTTTEDFYVNPIVIQNYEGASTNFRLAHRQAITSDIDAAGIGELRFLQSRCRYMIRNNSNASSARNKYVSSSGTIKVKWKTAKGKQHKIMQDLWDEFEESPSYDNKGNLTSFCATLRSDRFESGEFIARMITRKGNKVPLKLQGIESEYLDIGYMGDGTEQNNIPVGRTRYGITFDKETLSIPETYNFYKDRYFGIGQDFTPTNNNYVEVPAENVLHAFKRLRSNQWRGVPVLAPSLILLYEMEDLFTATIRTQTSASLVAWVISELNTNNLEPVGTVGLSGRRSLDDSVKQLHFDNTGGTVQSTRGKFNLVQSRDVGDNLKDLLKNGDQKLSSALNIPYHLFSGDTEGLNFSSIRAILSSYRKDIEFEFSIVDIPDFYMPLTKRFKDVSMALNYKVKDAIPTFEFPRWYGVDDLKDSQADLLEVISLQRPIQSVWAERGYTEEEIEESKQTLIRLGLGGMIGNSGQQTQNNSTPKSNTTGS